MTNLILDEKIKFESLNKYINSKIDDKSLSWVKFIKKFKKQGKQGVAGLLEINDELCVFKFSQYLNFLAEHEFRIMKNLNSLIEYCPHFCKTFNIVKHSVDGNYRKSNNPLEVTSKNPIIIDTILMEYIPGDKFYNFIKDLSVSEEAIFSTIKQTLMAISIAQRDAKLSHYDLHSCNILMKKCHPNDIFLYIMSEDNQICIPTYGYYPSIIDFGFSYAGVLDGHSICSPLAHTSVGFMTNQYDPITDIKLFLITVSDELRRSRSSQASITLRNMIRNIFEPLDIDLESGWDNTEDDFSASDYVTEKAEEIKVDSKIFTDYNGYAIDLIQKLIMLPIKRRSKCDFEGSYTLFVNEFSKIEEQISSSFINLYILKNIVDIAFDLKEEYLNKKTRSRSIKLFSQRVHSTINSVAKFCNPKINTEKLFCGLLVFSKAMENIMYKVISKRMEEKYEEYSQMKIQTPEEIYGAIEINIPCKYTFHVKNTVYVWDTVKKCNKQFKLSQEMIDTLNDTSPLLRGTILNDFYKDSIK